MCLTFLLKVHSQVLWVSCLLQSHFIFLLSFILLNLSNFPLNFPTLKALKNQRSNIHTCDAFSFIILWVTYLSHDREICLKKYWSYASNSPGRSLHFSYVWLFFLLPPFPLQGAHMPLLPKEQVDSQKSIINIALPPCFMLYFSISVHLDTKRSWFHIHHDLSSQAEPPCGSCLSVAFCELWVGMKISIPCMIILTTVVPRCTGCGQSGLFCLPVAPVATLGGSCGDRGVNGSN